MSLPDDHKMTWAYGNEAMGYIKEYKTSAYPSSYELWYTYASGFNRALNTAIDALISEGKVSEANLQGLYYEFLSPVRLSDHVEQVGIQISGEIEQVSQMLEHALTTTGTYSASLNNASKALSSTEDGRQVRAIVDAIVSATRSMSKQNRDLEMRLQQSHRLIRELREELEATRTETLTDPLTGIANRKHFDQSLEAVTSKANHTGDKVCLLMGDIDFFKKFNDTYGHQTGDQVLRLVGMSLRNTVKGKDVAARYGGEEFAVILPDTDIESAITVAEHIRSAVMAKELIKRSTGEHLGRITMSFGAAMYRRHEGAKNFLARADRCLYAAKHAGRNRVVSEMDKETLLAAGEAA